MGNDNRGVLILAATNMPWDVDPAMKRPGRFARQIFVPPPDAGRGMLKSSARLAAGGYAALARRTANFRRHRRPIEMAKNALYDALVTAELPLAQAI
jgi:SpoVK/Ycf46/Vps4 family AAA+-type ATPase